MSDTEKLAWFRSQFRPHFDEWVIEPARKMAFKVEEGYGMPAFVWLSCAVDWLASFWWGKSTKHTNKKAYVGFIKEFFPQGKYNAEDLYDSLRVGLVHLYTIKDSKYLLTHNNRNIHLKEQNGHILLNMENFYEDCVAAKNSYFDAVEADTSLLNNLIVRYHRDGFLGLVPITLPE